MKKNLLLISITIIGLSGCSNQPKKVIETEYIDYNKDVVVQELKDVSSAIKEAMLIMARNDNAVKSEILTPDQIRLANFNATYVPPGMERKIDFQWNGPAVNALKALAKYSDYEIFIGGNKPVAMLEPITIFNEKDIRIIDLIHLIESQTKNQLSIVPKEYQNRKILEVSYVRN